MSKLSKEERINEEFKKIKDGNKSRLFRKYNLTQYEIKVLNDVLCGEYRDFISENVYRILKDLGFIVIPYEIGFRYLEGAINE